MKCEDCGIDKADAMMRVLDVATKKGEKSDSAKSNNRALCTECVRSYPGREWMSKS